MRELIEALFHAVDCLIPCSLPTASLDARRHATLLDGRISDYQLVMTGGATGKALVCCAAISVFNTVQPRRTAHQVSQAHANEALLAAAADGDDEAVHAAVSKATAPKAKAKAKAKARTKKGIVASQIQPCPIKISSASKARLIPTRRFARKVGSVQKHRTYLN